VSDLKGLIGLLAFYVAPAAVLAVAAVALGLPLMAVAALAGRLEGDFAEEVCDAVQGR
jgi:hypothetical protein